MNKIKCPHCEKLYTKYGLGTHIWRTHTNEGKKFDPNKNREAWNKGLTKETDDRVKKNGEAISLANSGSNNFFYGKNHSEDSKKQISESRIKFLQENPDQVPYLLNHSSKISYPEQLLIDALNKRKVNGWVFQYQMGIYQYDFAFPELKLDVEVDGSTHNQEKVKKIDKKRDEWSNQQGWKVLRIPANKVNKDVNLVVDQILSFIDSTRG